MKKLEKTTQLIGLEIEEAHLILVLLQVLQRKAEEKRANFKYFSSAKAEEVERKDESYVIIRDHDISYRQFRNGLIIIIDQLEDILDLKNKAEDLVGE